MNFFLTFWSFVYLVFLFFLSPRIGNAIPQPTLCSSSQGIHCQASAGSWLSLSGTEIPKWRSWNPCGCCQAVTQIFAPRMELGSLLRAGYLAQEVPRYSLILELLWWIDLPLVLSGLNEFSPFQTPLSEYIFSQLRKDTSFSVLMQASFKAELRLKRFVLASL